MTDRYESIRKALADMDAAAEAVVDCVARVEALLSRYGRPAAVDEATCIAVYDAVSRANLTRDVKTESRKVAVVRDALAGQQQDRRRKRKA